MDFSLSDEQVALQEMSRDLFAKLYPPSRLRELWDGGERTDDAWQSMAEVGLTGLIVPEEYGGFGGTALDLMVVLEEAGRALVPDPLLETSIAAAVLTEAGGDLAQRWLPKMAAGEARASVQLDGYPLVADADVADVLLIARDRELRVVEAGNATVQQVETEDRTRRLFRVDAPGGESVGAPDTAMLYGGFAAAAVLNGIAGALLDASLDYVRVRHQFGVPVGSFQAVKHKLASVFTELESSRAATQYAAYTLVSGEPGAVAACMVAKALASDTEALANTEALQCHAGIGFTWEHDLHFWLKRGRALEHAYGSSREHRTALAVLLLDG